MGVTTSTSAFLNSSNEITSKPLIDPIPFSPIPHSNHSLKSNHPNPHIDIRSDALDQAKGLKLGLGETLDSHTAHWRRFIRDELPIISVDDQLASDLPLLRRAHLVVSLSILEEVDQNLKPALVPSTLAIPFCTVSQLLDIPPVLTYSDTVLYNWTLINPANGFTTDNVKILTTFTGTKDEEHFYKTSVLIEAARSLLDEALLADQLSFARISANLSLLASIIDQITIILEKVRDECEPACFYWLIRPWMNGGLRQMGDDGPVVNWGGPSAGQSTLIHSLDVFLGIDHRPRSTESHTTSHEATFMERMAAYMPHHHRNFLNHLAQTLGPNSQITIFPQLPNQLTHSVRSLASIASPDSAIFSSYNQSIQSLLKLRSTHSRIALLYVLSQSRVSPPIESPFLSNWEKSRELKKTVELGTGGTDLAKFLKRCRERTSEAIILS
ncbi:Indoleamine 2,3-dioxygenase [Melampsora americana]|nr:Indoleamine 2,3-dioxygenase [Melampsora americana]